VGNIFERLNRKYETDAMGEYTFVSKDEKHFSDYVLVSADARPAIFFQPNLLS
jgi:hypothetical protein